MVDEKPDDLEASQNDYWPTHMRLVAGAGGAFIGGPLGAIAGAVLGEVLAHIIPNQRLDRVTTYIKNLHANFSDLDFERIKSIPEKVALIEEGMLAAGLTPQAEKIERISNLVSNGLSQDEIDIENESYILNIVKSVTSSDIIILKYYHLSSSKNTESKSFEIKEYEKRHSALFDFKTGPIRQEAGVTSEKEERFKGHERYLLSLGLLIENSRRLRPPDLNNSLGNINFNTNSALQDAFRNLSRSINSTSYKITSLGIDMLRKIEPLEKSK